MEQIRSYVRGGHKQIQGWLDHRSAVMIAALGTAQHKLGLKGAVGEIGVHHGRLFILLALTAAEDEKIFALDLFENQSLNLDESGRGDRDILTANLRKNGLDPRRMDIITANSLDVSGEELLERVGPVRLLSIDGGHTEECVLNDLAIADRVLAPHGVIIMDDVFNSTWPAVVTGYAKYLLATPQTVPFASAPNKVFACRPELAGQYRSVFRNAFKRYYDRSDQFFGFDMDCYGMWAREKLARARGLD
jgi:hypothetical protein